MKKIKRELRVTNVATFADAAVKMLKEAGIEDAKLDKIIEKADSLSKKLTTAIKRDKTVSNLDEADSKRDELLRVLATMLEGYAVVPVEKISQSAKRLLAVFLKYGRQITAESYARESALVKSLLEDLSAQNFKADIENLTGVGETIEKLSEAEEDFRAKSAEYLKAGATIEESATLVKKELVSYANDTLIPYVKTLCALDESLSDLKSEFSALIEKANTGVVSK